jgi:HEPN domain-containing protein
MQPLDPDLASLIAEWLRKADGDLAIAQRVIPEGADLTMREILVFHCQQAVEKYLKALLTRFQVAFPKTHDIEKLLNLARAIPGFDRLALDGAKWLTPFGAEIRYPGDAPEVLPGDETRAIALAAQVRDAVLSLLSSASTPVSAPSQIDRSKLNELK